MIKLVHTENWPKSNSCPSPLSPKDITSIILRCRQRCINTDRHINPFWWAYARSKTRRFDPYRSKSIIYRQVFVIARMRTNSASLMREKSRMILADYLRLSEDEWRVVEKVKHISPAVLGRKLMSNIHTRLTALKVRYVVYQMIEDTMLYSHAQACQISSTSWLERVIRPLSLRACKIHVCAISDDKRQQSLWKTRNTSWRIELCSTPI